MAAYREPCRETLSRQGTVLSQGPDYTEVVLTAESACAACAIAGSCSAGSSTRTLRFPLNEALKQGDQVVLRMEARQGLLATLLIFVLPLLLIFLGVLLSLRLGASEEISAFAGLGLLGLYAIILKMLNPGIQKLMPVQVQKISAANGRQE